MNTRLIFAVIAAGSLFVMPGCGGGDGPAAPPAAPDHGAVTGSVALDGASAEGYRLLLNGAPLDVRVGPDGSFSIMGLPDGDHVLDVVGPDGMSGGRVEFSTIPGGTVRLPPIRTSLGGQIAGMVTKLEDGERTPLVGVEVVAHSEAAWTLDGPTTSSREQPLIYPSPPGATYTAYTAYTAEDGSYRMQAVKPGPYMVAVTVPGLVTGMAFVIVSPGELVAANFSLEPAVEPGVGAVEGTVWGIDDAGAATRLAGALVEVSMDSHWHAPPPPHPVPPPPVFSPPDAPQFEPGAAGAAEPGPGITLPDIYWNVFSTLTDREGRYRLNVPSGHAHIRAWKPSYEGDGRRITVQPGEVLTQDFRLGRLRDAPPPMPPWPGPGPRPEPAPEPPPTPPAPPHVGSR